MAELILTLTRTLFLPAGCPGLGCVERVSGDLRDVYCGSSGGEAYCLGEADILVEYTSPPPPAGLFAGGGDRPGSWQALLSFPFQLCGPGELPHDQACRVELEQLHWTMVASRAIELETAIRISYDEAEAAAAVAQPAEQAAEQAAEQEAEGSGIIYRTGQENEEERSGEWRMVTLREQEEERREIPPVEIVDLSGGAETDPVRQAIAAALAARAGTEREAPASAAEPESRAAAGKSGSGETSAFAEAEEPAPERAPEPELGSEHGQSQENEQEPWQDREQGSAQELELEQNQEQDQEPKPEQREAGADCVPSVLSAVDVGKPHPALQLSFGGAADSVPAADEVMPVPERPTVPPDLPTPAPAAEPVPERQPNGETDTPAEIPRRSPVPLPEPVPAPAPAEQPGPALPLPPVLPDADAIPKQAPASSVTVVPAASAVPDMATEAVAAETAAEEAEAVPVRPKRRFRGLPGLHVEAHNNDIDVTAFHISIKL